MNKAREFDQSVVSELKALLGDRVSTSQAVREHHGKDESYFPYALPDVVVFASSTEEVRDIVNICRTHRVPMIPYGVGTSLEGHILAVKGGVCIDLSQMNKVLAVHESDLDAVVQAGVTRKQLNEHIKHTGLFFPVDPGADATLGGMAATRASGTNAVRYGTMRENVLSLKVVLADGRVIQTSRRAKKSAAGYDLTRLFVGSEGTLGIITEAWMRLQDRPRFRTGGAVRFKDLFAAARALRVIAQAGLYPANCRILDPAEAYNTGAGDGKSAIMVLAFESGDHPVEPWMKRALECCADHGGTPEIAEAADAHRSGAAELWRTAFIRMPYARERTVGRAIINDTFETAITWERFEGFHDKIKAAAEAAIKQATGRAGQVTCRFTHVYPDGPAPYFTFHALGRHGALLEQWQAIKNAASDALIAAGGTITHHHAVGRQHRPWYDKQRPDLFAAALKAAKQALDPQGLLNPGILLDA